MNNNYILIKFAHRHQTRMQQFIEEVEKYASNHGFKPLDIRFFETPDKQSYQYSSQMPDPNVKNQYRSSMRKVIINNPDVANALGVFWEFHHNDSTKIPITLRNNGVVNFYVFGVPSKREVHTHRKHIDRHFLNLEDGISTMYNLYNNKI